MGVKDQFVAAFLDALPDGWDRSEESANRKFANIIGTALEKLVVPEDHSRHTHFHLTEKAFRQDRRRNGFDRTGSRRYRGKRSCLTSDQAVCRKGRYRLLPSPAGR